MIKYHIRSRNLVDIYNEIKLGKIILSPYFQRKLVWRDGHKVDFIKTILLGYPFPEIFLSRGKIDLSSKTSRSSIVDGQQRMSAICDYVDGNFSVEGKKFQDLTASQQENFLNYEIAIIDLDLADNDAKIVEIFQRLNRTFYALSDIEKMSTEFASSEFMLVAKLLCHELPEDDDGEENVKKLAHEENPNITKEFVDWANKQQVSEFQELVLQTSIFTRYEISRNVHLRFTLNVMATTLAGYYNRNELLKEMLELHSQSFAKRDEIVKRLNDSAGIFLNLKLKDSDFWFAKSNAFSLLCMIAERCDELKAVRLSKIKKGLNAFAGNPPEDYALAAREGVNNKKERELRRRTLDKVITGSI